MIGLEFVCKTFEMEYKTVAEQIGVSPATIQDWLKGRRKIPDQRLEQLAAFFGIDKKYFPKEINDAERLEIQMLYIQHISKDHDEVIDIMDYDDEGNEIRYQREYNQYEEYYSFLSEQHEKVEMMLRIKSILEEYETGDPYKFEIMKDVVRVFEGGDGRDFKVLKMVLFYLIYYKKGWGGVKPEYSLFKHENDLIDEFDRLLKKHNM